jgi:hypothetical protein
MNFDEENVKKKNELPKESVKGLTGIVCVCVVLMVFGLVSTVPEETQGVVEKRDKNLLYVRNLKDTSQYFIFTSQTIFWPSEVRAFPHVVTGDTLTYAKHIPPTVSFGAVKRINSKKLADFAKEREKLQRDALQFRTK